VQSVYRKSIQTLLQINGHKVLGKAHLHAPTKLTEAAPRGAAFAQLPMAIQLFGYAVL
jgi:hypothetical protein